MSLNAKSTPSSAAYQRSACEGTLGRNGVLSMCVSTRVWPFAQSRRGDGRKWRRCTRTSTSAWAASWAADSCSSAPSHSPTRLCRPSSCPSRSGGALRAGSCGATPSSTSLSAPPSLAAWCALAGPSSSPFSSLFVAPLPSFWSPSNLAEEPTGLIVFRLRVSVSDNDGCRGDPCPLWC